MCIRARGRISEGGAERAIIDLLLDHHKLIFEREDLIEQELLRCRNAKAFQQRYLRKGFTDKITVYRILDSNCEQFKLSKAYEKKIDVKNIITAPEIEKLLICNAEKNKEFQREKRKNKNLKPSQFCKNYFKDYNIKSYDFIKEYFADIDILVNALHEY